MPQDASRPAVPAETIPELLRRVADIQASSSETQRQVAELYAWLAARIDLGMIDGPSS